jgi:hypothetical protein
LNHLRHSHNGSKPDPPSADDMGDLGQRILSGEFTEEGSTKERLSRPVRKLLAKDPIGPGDCNVWLKTNMRLDAFKRVCLSGFRMLRCTNAATAEIDVVKCN